MSQTSVRSILVAIVIVGVSSLQAEASGGGSETDPRARMAAAEALEKAGDFEGCGRTWLGLYRDHPNHRDAAMMLYNAGVCFEQARAVGLAIKNFATLVRRHPRSKLAQRALVRSAYLHASIARFREAAVLYEQYAAKYGGKLDADNALSNAAHYRLGVGDHAAAIANMRAFVSRYGRKRRYRRQVAETAYQITTVLEDSGASASKRKAALETFLSTQRSAPRWTRIAAIVRLGKLLWEQSCSLGARTEINGCVAMARKSGRCGVRRLRVGRRNRRLAREAQKWFRRALKQARRPHPDAGAKAPIVDHWAFTAEFYLLEDEFENVIATLPTRRARSLEARLKQAVHRWRSSPWAPAAVARLAQLETRLAEAAVLQGAGSCVDRRANAEALSAKADAAWAFCVSTAQALNRPGPWARLCMGEVDARAEGRSPRIDELLPTPAEWEPVLRVDIETE